MYQEFGSHQLFDGVNIAFMVCAAIASVTVITATFLSSLFDRSKEKEITIAQIEADAQVKVAEWEAQSDIERARIKYRAQLPSEINPEEPCQEN